VVFSCTEGNTIHSFRISDFGTFEQSGGFRLENALDLSGSKYSVVEPKLI
jgi:transcription factor TGA